MRNKRLIAMFGLFAVQGCISNGIDPSVQERFKCMSAPSGLYVPGTVLRTIAGERGEDIDELTIAYAPILDPNLKGGYADITRTVGTSLTGSLVFERLKKLGFGGNIALEAAYNLRASAIGNSHIAADDSILASTLRRFEGDEAVVIQGAKYFFIKEALASDRILYVASGSTGVDAELGIDAAHSDASVELKLGSGSQRIEGRKLFACIVAERIQVTRSKGFLGVDTLKPVSSAPSSTEDYAELDTIAAN